MSRVEIWWIFSSSCNFLWVLEDLGMENETCFFLVDVFLWGIAMDCLTPFPLW